LAGERSQRDECAAQVGASTGQVADDWARFDREGTERDKRPLRRSEYSVELREAAGEGSWTRRKRPECALTRGDEASERTLARGEFGENDARGADEAGDVLSLTPKFVRQLPHLIGAHGRAVDR